MKNKLFKPVLSAMLLALGLVLPFLTGQIQSIGNMLLPMHIPVLLCGFICGPQYGITVGFIMPLMRSALFGMPVMFPGAIAMAFELGAYGLLSGFLFRKAKWQCIRSLYRSLIMTMLGGRIVWGIAMAIIMYASSGVFTLKAFLAGAFTNAIPGIIIQLIIIPAVMLALDKTHLVTMKKHKHKNNCTE